MHKTEQPHTPPECDHHWISYMQPSAGLSWIRQCSQCRDFDADDLQEQIAAAEQRGAIKALRDTATQMESTADTLSELWEHYMLPGDIIAWLRHRADQMEG